MFVDEIVITSNGQDIIELIHPYVRNIGMLSIYRNGVLQQKGIFQEETSTTLKYVGGNPLLHIGEVITVEYKITGDLRIGDLRVVEDLTALSLISDPIPNEIAIVISAKKFFHYDGVSWQEWVIPFSSQNIGMLFQHESQQITNTATKTYVLGDISYSPGMGDMLVFINGIPYMDFTEVDAKTFTFNTDIPLGTMDIFVANTDPWEDSISHRVDYTYYAGDYVHTETIKLGTRVVKRTEFSYTSNGNVKKEIITKDSKSITKTYTYDDYDNVISVDVSVLN
jgi:hypothetical protein